MKFLIDIPELFITSAGIYKISNNKDKRVYIGRTKNLINRAEEHKYAYKHRKCNYKVRDFIEKHPDAVFTFSVILFTNDIKKRKKSQSKNTILWIMVLISSTTIMNLQQKNGV